MAIKPIIMHDYNGSSFDDLYPKTSIEQVEGLKDALSEYADKEYVDEKIAEIPPVPTKVSELENDSNFITAEDIPPVPTKTSELENDSNYITSEDIPTIPTKTSELVNDSNFITEDDIPAVPTKVSELANDSNYISEETDPTVPAWAKTAEKPMYDVDEITNAQPVMHAFQYIDLSGMGYDIAVQEDREAAICDAVSNYVDFDTLNAAGVYAFTVKYGWDIAYYFVTRCYDNDYPDDPYYLVMEYMFKSYNDDNVQGLRAYSLSYDQTHGFGWFALQDFEAASKDYVNQILGDIESALAAI